MSQLPGDELWICYKRILLPDGIRRSELAPLDLAGAFFQPDFTATFAPVGNGQTVLMIPFLDRLADVLGRAVKLICDLHDRQVLKVQGDDLWLEPVGFPPPSEALLARPPIRSWQSMLLVPEVESI